MTALKELFFETTLFCDIFIPNEFAHNNKHTLTSQYIRDNIGLFYSENFSRNAESCANNKQKWVFAEPLTTAISQANTWFRNFSRLTLY